MTSPTRSTALPAALRLAAVAAAALLLAGCSGGAAPTPDGAAPLSSAAAPAADTAAPGGADPSAGGSPTAAVVTSMTTFRSPTGNISCYLSPVQGSVPYARCDLATASWDVAAPQDGCAGTWGGSGRSGSVGVGGGDAEPLCVSDIMGDPSAQTLGYGSAIVMEPLTCTSVSATIGMTCKNDETGHGFTVRKEKLDLF